MCWRVCAEGGVACGAAVCVQFVRSLGCNAAGLLLGGQLPNAVHAPPFCPATSF